MRAIAITPAFENVAERVDNLIDTVTYETFKYTSRGLFEQDKLIFTALVGWLAWRYELGKIWLTIKYKLKSFVLTLSFLYWFAYAADDDI